MKSSFARLGHIAFLIDLVVSGRFSFESTCKAIFLFRWSLPLFLYPLYDHEKIVFDHSLGLKVNTDQWLLHVAGWWQTCGWRRNDWRYMRVCLLCIVINWLVNSGYLSCIKQGLALNNWIVYLFPWRVFPLHVHTSFCYRHDTVKRMQKNDDSPFVTRQQ